MENKHFDEIKSIVGKSYYVSPEKISEEILYKNYEIGGRVSCLVQPGSSFELKQVIDYCRENYIKYYPIGSGRNWGYGGNIPVKGEHVVISLERLNQISSFDQDVGVISIGAGVTQGQLFDYLKGKKSDLTFSVTSAGKDTTIISNILERGIGAGKYANRVSSLHNLEVLLPTGEFIGSTTDEINSHMVGDVFGPSFDGVFCQSNLGIVTKATLWLESIPENMGIITFSFKKDADGYNTIDWIKKMLDSEVLKPGISIFNDYRVYSTLLPESKASYHSKADMKAFFKEKGFPFDSWNGEITLKWDSRSVLISQLEFITDKLKKTCTNVTYEVFNKDELRRLRNDEETSAVQSVSIALLRKYLGVPHDFALKQLYWKVCNGNKSYFSNQNGMIWICPLIPAAKKHVVRAVSIIERIASENMIEPCISLQWTNSKCIHLIASFHWDRENSLQEDKIIIAYKTIIDQLFSKGYFPYRFGNNAFVDKKDLMISYTLYQKMKKALDPENLLSSNKYE